jgi:hypothetical protein
MIVIPAMALLGACAALEPVERVVRVPVPVSPPSALLRCIDAPAPPAGEYTQDDVSGFVLDLSEAGEDCREKLDAVRRHVERGVAAEWAGSGSKPPEGGM